MTTKQQQPETDDYPLTKEELLDEFTRMEQVVDMIRRINDNANLTYTQRGLDTHSMKPYSREKSINELYVQYEDDMDKKKRLRFLENTTNRDGTWRTLDNLISQGTITQEVKNAAFFPKDKLPSRKIVQLHRVKLLSGEEYITRFEEWKGIGRNGSIINCSVRVGRYTEPTYTTEFAPVDPDRPEGPTVRVAKLPQPMGEYPGVKRYTDPYSEDKIRKYQKHMRGQLREPRDGHSFLLYKEGEHNPTSCNDPEKFAATPFDTLWTELTKPKPADLSKLVDELTRQLIAAQAEQQKHDQAHYS